MTDEDPNQRPSADDVSVQLTTIAELPSRVVESSATTALLVSTSLHSTAPLPPITPKRGGRAFGRRGVAVAALGAACLAIALVSATSHIAKPSLTRPARSISGPLGANFGPGLPSSSTAAIKVATTKATIGPAASAKPHPTLGVQAPAGPPANPGPPGKQHGKGHGKGNHGD